MLGERIASQPEVIRAFVLEDSPCCGLAHQPDRARSSAGQLAVGRLLPFRLFRARLRFALAVRRRRRLGRRRLGHLLNLALGPVDGVQHVLRTQHRLVWKAEQKPTRWP